MVDFSGLEPNNREPVYIQIASYIKKQILLGHIVDGDPMPSRREVAAALGINPNTAQKAFRLMEEEDYVITSGTSGSTVHIDNNILHRIESELTREMAAEFIRAAKDINLSFKRVIDLISEMWDAE
jgi:GntR family transcriptional regulator